MMTQAQIYYDDIELDLPDSEVIPITKQVNEIGDLNVFKSDFSQEFRIERTRAMNKVFENAGLIRSESLLPYQALDVKVTSQGMEVLPVAKLSLNRADNEYFYCTVFAGVKPLFQSLSKKLLSGLDLTDLEHTWNTATAVASLIADLDYQYLLFDGSDDGELIGFDADRLEFQTETLRPFVKVKRLLNDIFSTIVAPNPVAYWSFDEAAGTVAYDSSGNGNDGTLVGGVTRVDGVSGGALSFNGTTGYVALESDIEIHALSAWINFWEVDSLTYFFGSLSLGDGLRYSGTGFRISGENGLGSVVAWTRVDRLVHFVANRDSDGNYTIYIDSEYIGTTSIAGGVGRVRIGNFARRHDGFYFDGIIDEPRIYSCALTQVEITGLYNNPNGKNNTVTFPADTLLDKMFLTIENTKIDGTKAYNVAYKTTDAPNFSFDALIRLETVISDPLGLVADNRFTAPATGIYNVWFRFSSPPPGDGENIRVFINVPEYDSSFGTTAQLIPITNVDETGTSYAAGSFELGAGENASFYYELVGLIGSYPENIYFGITGFKQEFIFDTANAVAPFLPEITHGEFLKGICKLFGLVPSYDFLNDQVELWSLSSVLTNKRIAKNWSGYMDYSDTQINFRLDYAQINRMQYKEDEDVNEGNGDSSIQVNDENLELEKDLFKLPFSFAESVTKETSGSPVLSDEMARIAWYETIEDSVEYNEKTSIAARLVTREDMTLTTRIGATDLTAAQSKKALGLRLENVLPYYEGLTTMLTSTKVLVQKFNLPATEIAALDHSVPVYLDYYNSYFFVKRVRNWIDGELCNVELIRI